MQPSILKTFLSITQEQIQRELDEPEKLLSKFQQKYFPKGKWRRPSTPEEKALWFHHNLVLASAMHAHGESPSEKIMYFACETAEQIAFRAMVESFTKGRLGRMEARHEAMRREAGFLGFLGWPGGQGPPKYEALSNEMVKLMHRIKSTVLLEIYERYRLTSIAGAYEKDPKTYQHLAQEARQARSVSPEFTDGTKLHLEPSHFEKLVQGFGPNILIYLKHHVRLAEIHSRTALNRNFHVFRFQRARDKKPLPSPGLIGGLTLSHASGEDEASYEI